jgi:nucleoside-diphosphate-sugar epimerase
MKDLSVTILIPPAVYGPRDRDIYAYFKLAKIGIAPFLGRQERYLSLIYVGDLARAAVDCLRQNEAAGGKYLVEDGEIHTWRSFAYEISTATGRKAAAVVLPIPFARAAAVLAETFARITGRPPLLGRQKMHELMQPSWTCTGERIRQELGFQPRYPLPKGVEETYNWYRKHHWL